jgi:predicted nuclease of predicted toxin-antitoxin system
MRLYADECVYAKTVRLLRDRLHDVLSVYDEALQQVDDEILLQRAQQLERVFLTRDKEFSNILLYPPSVYRGIIVLRMKVHDESAVHSLLLKFLEGKSEFDLKGKLVIVSKDKIRVRSK